MRLFIGLMSGTSMDGIDVALVDMNTNTLIAGLTRPYSEKAKGFLLNVLGQEQTRPAVLYQLNTLLGREFAQAVFDIVEKAKISSNDVIAIGSHGQTICHDATADIPYTLQLGCPHTIAELTGIKVVADFRTRDLVVGGQGAPFAPAYHQALFAGKELPLAVVNIGGIANITYLKSNDKVYGHDIGPGNCLLDAWVLKHRGTTYDQEGAWAATGQVIQPLLSALLEDPYFKRPSPKSLGKEYFSTEWLASYLYPNLAPNDVQATLLELTAVTIINDIKNCGLELKRLAICGGGAHNCHLQHALRAHLPSLQIDSTKALGIDPDFLEAMMFAWFADKTLSGTSLDLKEITGAKNRTILGAIYAAGVNVN